MLISYLWLQIAMQDLDTGLAEKHECLQELHGKASDEFEWESDKLVLAQQLVEINLQQLVDEAEMITVLEVLLEPNNVFRVIGIVGVYSRYYLHLHHALLEVDFSVL